MDYLNKTQIINLIEDYLLEDFYNYAVMINGSWGSGKTHFIKEVLVPTLEEKKIARKAVYVSLYGLKSSEEIAAYMLTSIIEIRMGKTKKMLPILRGGINVITDILGGKLDSETVKNLNESLLSPFINFDEYYFIFDDLERCLISINESLGYINNFIEQNNAKVLLIAHEEEIGSAEFSEHILMRYFIASQDTVKWPQKEKKDFFSRSNTASHTPEKPTLEDLEYRIEQLMKENTFYLQIKEKIVGQTVYYQPNLQEIVPTIFSKCLNLSEPDLEKSLIEKTCGIMESENYYNLRTLQFSLSFLAKIINESLIPVKDKRVYCVVILHLLESILKVAIHHKKGQKPYDWDQNSEYGRINLSHEFNFFGYFNSFRFVHEYVYYGNYNLSHIKDIMRVYCQQLSNRYEKESDPVNVLDVYWEMEDNDVEENLTDLYHNLESGKYEARAYKYILSLLFKLKGIGFEPIPISKHRAIMEKNVANGATINTMQEPRISKDDPCFDEYIECLEELKQLQDSMLQIEKSTSINKIFQSDQDWGTAFVAYYADHKEHVLSERGFFKDIDIEACYNAILKGRIKDLSDFRRTIYSIYDFGNIKDYYSNDIENIEKLYSMLDTNFEGIMKQYNIKLLREDLRLILERLK